ncbi:MAG: hypothetical protein KKB50_20790 [Planctomycetes bacterium]|nr:hypothetical protein [Planctomycetota bacterium]
MSTSKTLGTLAVLVAACFLVGGGACVVSVDPAGNGGGGGTGSNYTTTVNVTHGGADDNAVKIIVVNSTGETLDPEIYVSTEAVIDTAELFTDARKYTSFGVGNRGLLGDFDTDSFTLECATARVIGTQGGLFGDDLENPDGVGQQRILVLDSSYTCGDTITFTFSR